VFPADLQVRREIVYLEIAAACIKCRIEKLCSGDSSLTNDAESSYGTDFHIRSHGLIISGNKNCLV